MITLITGLPGAGKTLYTVDKLLRDLVGSSVSGETEDGISYTVPRVLFTNINKLRLDHELIDASPDAGLSGWHNWAKPGAVICYDEVQKVWSPRPNGSKVPEDIKALETHRHMGIDFILLTQNPMLIDQNVRALVNRHLHVRRMGGTGFTIVYEWDSCSRGLLYSKALAKAPYKYDKSVFSLYKSSELHTKSKSRIPTLAYVVLAAVGAAVYFIPSAFNAIASKSDIKSISDGVASSVPGVPSPAAVSPGQAGSNARGSFSLADYVPVIASMPWTAPAYDSIRTVVSMPTIAGGVCSASTCKCYSHQGTVVLEGSDCRAWLDRPPFDPYSVRPDKSTPLVSSPAG